MFRWPGEWSLTAHEGIVLRERSCVHAFVVPSSSRVMVAFLKLPFPIAGTFYRVMTSNPDSRTESTQDGASDPDIDALVRRAQKGDAEAFDALVRTYSQRMYGLAYRMVGNHSDAADLAQEIFIKLHKSIGKFRWKWSRCSRKRKGSEQRERRIQRWQRMVWEAVEPMVQ